VRWSSDDPDVASAWETHGQWIAAETLALSVTRQTNEGIEVEIEGRPVTLAAAVAPR
jgi:hypothetical protein